MYAPKEFTFDITLPTDARGVFALDSKALA